MFEEIIELLDETIKMHKSAIECPQRHVREQRIKALADPLYRIRSMLDQCIREKRETEKHPANEDEKEPDTTPETETAKPSIGPETEKHPTNEDEKEPDTTPETETPKPSIEPEAEKQAEKKGKKNK